MSQPPDDRIVLPEDESIRLFVLSEASNLVITEMFTDVVYDVEIKNKQISALTRMPRDMHTGYEQRLAAEKRDKGLVEDIPATNVLKRIPNYYTMAFVALVGLVVLAWGQWTGNLSAWYAGAQANAGAIVAGAILFLALLLALRFRRRRPKQ